MDGTVDLQGRFKMLARKILDRLGICEDAEIVVHPRFEIESAGLLVNLQRLSPMPFRLGATGRFAQGERRELSMGGGGDRVVEMIFSLTDRQGSTGVIARQIRFIQDPLDTRERDMPVCRREVVLTAGKRSLDLDGSPAVFGGFFELSL